MMDAALIVIGSIALSLFSFIAGYYAARNEYVPRRDSRGRFVR